MFKHLAILLGSLLASASASGADRYVAPSGSDSNAGTLGAPLKTIQRAVDLSVAGDSVIVRAGIYRGTVSFVGKKGTASAPIRLFGYPGERPLLQGSAIVTGWVNAGSAIWRKSGWSVASQQVFDDGALLQQIGMPSVYSSLTMSGQPVYTATGSGVSTMVAGSFYYDAAGTSLYVWLADGSDPNASLIEASTARRILQCDANCAYIEISNLSFRHSSSSAFEQMGAAIDLAANCTLRDCDVQWCDFAGVSLGWRQSGVRLIDCLIANNGDVGIQGSEHQNFLISGCEVSDNNVRRFNTFWHAGAMKFATDCDGAVVGCHVHDNRGAGIWYDFCDSGRPITVRANYAHGNNTAGSGVMIECSANAVVSNNVLVANDNRGIYISASDNVKVTNNTVIATLGRAAIDVSGMPRTGRTLTNVAVYNNIVSATTAQYDLIFLKENGTDIFGLSGGSNCIWRGGNALSLLWGSTKYTSVAAWAATPFAAQCVQADPGFINAGSSDYSITINSPACNAGATRSEVADDFSGLPRPQGSAYDLGAYEAAEVSPECPSIVTPAASSPSVVSAVTSSLAVSATDDGGVDALTYTWRVEAGAPAPVYFNRNGTNAAKRSQVTFDKAGIYDFTVAVTDGVGNTSESSVRVEVAQSIASVRVSPATAALRIDESLALSATAIDQFGDALSTQPAFVWSTAAGTIAATGWFTAPSAAANAFPITASAGSLSGSCQMTVSDGFAVSVNFQPAQALVPASHLVDSGQPFGDRGNGKSYGWNALTDECRDRNDSRSPDQAYDTFIHLQKPSNPDAVWEIALPNGDYQVRLVCGDPTLTKSVFAMDVEGSLLLSGAPSKTLRWIDHSGVVSVSDGRLTVRSGAGAVNNKLCFIEIVAVPTAGG